MKVSVSKLYVHFGWGLTDGQICLAMAYGEFVVAGHDRPHMPNYRIVRLQSTSRNICAVDGGRSNLRSDGWHLGKGTETVSPEAISCIY